MYKQCGGTKDKPSNCIYNKPAVMQTDTAYVELMHETCPQFVNHTKYSNTVTACCDIKQLATLQTSLHQAKNLLGRCPGCIRNFYNFWCEFTCSPDQSLFLDVYPASTDPKITGHADYHMTSEFANNFFQSCVDVISPQTNGRALDLMCGGTEAVDCTPKKFLDFLGNPANAPFLINMFIDPKKPSNHSANTTVANATVPMDIGIIKCNESFLDPVTGKNASQCSCEDCAGSCPVPPTPPPKKKIHYIMGLQEWIFIVGLIYVLLLFMYVTCSVTLLVLRGFRKRPSSISQSASLPQYGSISSGSTYHAIDPNKCQVGSRQPGCLVSCGISVEHGLKSIFQTWGTWCAYHPWTVILVSLIIVISLSCGMVNFKVTTNPVYLWTSGNSEARRHKEYFDNKFGPFYRSEQVIITAKAYDEVYKVYPNNKKRFYNGIIHKDILHEVIILHVVIYIDRYVVHIILDTPQITHRTCIQNLIKLASL